MQLKEGQVWTYDNRVNEPNSKAIILKIEDSNDGSIIVHIHVNGIKINNPNSTVEIEEFTHMPFAIEAIGASINTLVGESKIPDYLDAFIAWKEEFMNGRAGVFSTTIGESVQYMDDSING